MLAKIFVLDQPEVGVSIGLCFFLGNAVSGSLYVLGEVETFLNALPSAGLHKDYSVTIINDDHKPIATILHTEAFKDIMAPLVTEFSSRGPNPISPEILKPDITAPGANILPTWSPLALFSVDIFDKRTVDYNIISGTSMSCPHATGAATYVKASHPDWSPAAIKSALMTTATIMDPRKNSDAEFAYGSGQIDPLKAVDPGLVFDALEADYEDFLCNEGYNASLVRLISGDASKCSSPGKTWDLNYPSFALSLLDGEEAFGSASKMMRGILPDSVQLTADNRIFPGRIRRAVYTWPLLKFLRTSCSVSVPSPILEKKGNSSSDFLRDKSMVPDADPPSTKDINLLYQFFDRRIGEGSGILVLEVEGLMMDITVVEEEITRWPGT
ncbi:hypothetical protein POM88_036638 [Heracleum sosnowskyi]|uniref:Peptidase S8/S53 domain-containing protein n=1 Tax=Heracleum sosnowskyi TaxID=360622 RepID=A0AAD8MEH8_9APIA|nr:hypothetical protein POM88_036638 [Heracleum sosnowskyi]